MTAAVVVSKSSCTRTLINEHVEYITDTTSYIPDYSLHQ